MSAEGVEESTHNQDRGKRVISNKQSSKKTSEKKKTQNLDQHHDRNLLSSTVQKEVKSQSNTWLVGAATAALCP